MKSTYALILPITLIGLTACDVGSNHRQDELDTTKMLYDNRPQNGRIAEVGEVDWYEFQPTQNNSQVAIEVLSDTVRSDVELLVTLFQEGENGELDRLYADHAPEGAVAGADLVLNYQLSNNDPVLISVRDLMDDEAASGDYRITAQEGMNDQGNDVLTGAVELSVNGACISDRIDSMGDVDLFRFTLSENEVTSIATSFNAQSDGSVQLNFSLYGEDALLVDSWSESQNGIYSLRRYLEAGTYTLAVDDFGRNDFDLSSPFETCVTTIADQEAMENDTQDTADVYDLASANPTLQGSIGHQADVDWYQLEIPVLAGSDLQLLDVTLNSNQSGHDLQYTIMDENGDIKFSWNHKAGSGEYSQQILLGVGDHSMSVTLADGERLTDAADYSVTLQEVPVNDSAELSGGNNRIETATELTSGTPTVGKIAYRGDIDWYVLEIAPSVDTYQVLELSLTSNMESAVAYRMQIMLDELIAAIDDPLPDNILDVSTAILVPPLQAGEVSGVRRYFVKVSDVYAEKSDQEATYSLEGTLRSLNSFELSQLPAGVDANRTVFTAEPDELQRLENEEHLVQLELNGYTTQTFAVDAESLKFLDPLDAGTSQRTVNDDGSISIDLPWLAGFIDYSGDQDWYVLDLTNFGYLVDNGSGPETVYSDENGDWHYLIQIDLMGKAGEKSEYQWKLYRDPGQDYVVRNRPKDDGDGYFAQQGDTTLTDEALSLTTEGMTVDDKPEFWVSNDWNERFYLAISDFEFRKIPSDESINPVTDNDWSAPESPYAVKVSLRYVPGVHHPE